MPSLLDTKITMPSPTWVPGYLGFICVSVQAVGVG